MTVALTEAELVEARGLLARLSELLQDRAAPANDTAPPAELRAIGVAGLSDADVAEAAARLRCPPAAVRAVWQVESSGVPFGFDRRPTLLFEPHKFSEFTGHRFDKTHGGVSYPKWGQKPYPTGTVDQRHAANWDKLLYAARLDRDAAYMAASYGGPQILGANFKACGFADVHAFVAAMCRSERDQLQAFVSLVLDWKLDDELRDGRWADFARRYNGPAYARNTYDAKLASAFKQWSQA